MYLVLRLVLFPSPEVPDDELLALSVAQDPASSHNPSCSSVHTQLLPTKTDLPEIRDVSSLCFRPNKSNETKDSSNHLHARLSTSLDLSKKSARSNMSKLSRVDSLRASKPS